MRYFWFDAHCDALIRALGQETLETNTGQFDFARARAAGGGVQVMAVFPGGPQPLYEQVDAQIGLLEQALVTSALSLCRTGDDIKRCVAADTFAPMLSLEGADALESDLSRMEVLFRRGVRLLGLTWNYDNALCGSNAGEQFGLTALGRDGVRQWEELGGLADVSHVSDQAFWDILETARRPVIASHSCCRALCGHRRNLTDEQLRALADKGGVMGINFYPPFLSESGRAAISDVADHIVHALAAGGEDAVGLGSDFDGISTSPEGLGGVQDLHRLIPALEQRGLSPRVIEKVMGGNFCRVISEGLG